MVERGQGAGFAFEASDPLGVGRQILRENLDRHVSPKLRIMASVCLTHASGADLLDDLVVGEGFADHVAASSFI
jgi:hypothetical protein